MKKFTDYCIDHPAVTFLILAGVIWLGVTAFRSMPVEDNPDVQVPVALILTTYPGAMPDDIEKEVTEKIEKQLSELNGLDSMQSASHEGYSITFVEFDAGLNIDNKLREVREKVNEAQTELPDDANDPEVIEVSTTEIPVMTLSLSGELSMKDQKILADDLKDRLETLNSVAEVQIYGIQDRQLQVRVNPERLNAYGLSLQQIIRVLQLENVNVPAGEIDIGSSNFSVRAVSKFEQLEDIENVVLTSYNGRLIHVSDVAGVIDSFEDRATIARLNGVECVNLAIKKRSGGNTIATAKEIKKIIDSMSLPEGVKIQITGNQADDASYGFSMMSQSVLFGGAFVVIVLMGFMGFRNAFIVSMAIPISVLFAFIVMWLKGFSINNVAMFGLVIAIGILVDDSIIVVENCYRYLELGVNRKTAAKRGIHEIGTAILAAGSTNIASFAPMLIITGVSGEFMKYIPYTFIFSMMGAIILAHTVMPTFAAVLLRLPPVRKAAEKRSAKKATNGQEPAETTDLEAGSWDGLTFEQAGIKNVSQFGLIAMIRRPYRAFVKFVLTTFLMDWAVLAAFVVAFLAVIFLAMHRVGFEFFPVVDKGQFTLDLKLPVGTKIEHTDRMAKLVEEKLKDYSDIEFFTASVGSPGPSTSWEFGGGGDNYARINVNLFREDNQNIISYWLGKFRHVERYERAKDTNRIEDELRPQLDLIPGLDYEFVEAVEGPPRGADIQIRIHGDDFRVLDNLRQTVRKTVEEMGAQTKEGKPVIDLETGQQKKAFKDIVDNYSPGKPEIQVKFDRDKLAYHGLDSATVGMGLRAALEGMEATKMFIGDEELDVVVQFEERFAKTEANLREISFPNAMGRIVPFDQVARTERTTGLSVINRYNQKRTVEISMYRNAVSTPVGLKMTQDALAGMRLPSGYTITYGGENEESDRAIAQLYVAFCIAMLVIYVIMVVEFGSLIQPLVIMGAIPFSMIGVGIGLMLSGGKFGFMAMMAVVALSGLVVNDAIVMVDTINRVYRGTGKKNVALLEAGALRFRPILMTSITTIVGILPLAANLSGNGEFWAPFGWSLIFGLIASTLLNLLLVPFLYRILTGLEEWCGRNSKLLVNLFFAVLFLGIGAVVVLKYLI